MQAYKIEELQYYVYGGFMPVEIEYTKDNIGVVLFAKGIVTGKELTTTIKNVYNDERFISLKYWIGDRTACGRFLLNEKELVAIAKLNEKESQRNPGILLALVAPNAEAFGVSRQFEAHGEDSKFVTQVFRDRQSANEWIDQNLKRA